MPISGEELRRLVMEQVRRWTEELRTSEDPRWRRVRRHLHDEGIAPTDVVVGDVSIEDTALEFAVLITRDERVITFYFDVSSEEPGRALRYEDAKVIEWTLVEEHRKLAHVDELALAREVFG